MHADGHGWEAWRTMPHEQDRFYELVKRTHEDNIILLSGDRHAGGIYKREGLYEVTSSSLNRAFYRPKDITDTRKPIRSRAAIILRSAWLVIASCACRANRSLNSLPSRTDLTRQMIISRKVPMRHLLSSLPTYYWRSAR